MTTTYRKAACARGCTVPPLEDVPEFDVMEALHFRSLIDVGADIGARRLSSLDVTDAMLDRIADRDAMLHAYRCVAADLAREQARRADLEIAAGRRRGPLHGVPIAVKDLCFTRGIPTSAGMPMYRDRRPSFDATVVARLEQAGAVLLGKLNMTEGASFVHHPNMPIPVNPWRGDLWPGVSSSGSGVATAAGLCFASVGSDTGASIRCPAACNGLTGVKPTWGRVSRHGIFPFAETFDVVGPMARSAADAAVMLQVMAGWDAEDPTSLSEPVPDYLAELGRVEDMRGLRIGIDPVLLDDVHPEVASAIGAMAVVLAEIGASVREVRYPDTTDLWRGLRTLSAIEMAAAHSDTFPAAKELYGSWIGATLTRGREADPIDVARAVIERERFRGRFRDLLSSLDIMLLPVLPGPTPTWDEIDAVGAQHLAYYTMPINAAGAPAIAVPRAG